MDDIIRMAREAGIADAFLVTPHPGVVQQLERFAELAQADERNKLAAWMMAQGYATGHGDTIEQLLEELRWQVRESEREACLTCYSPDDTAQDWADKIRARSQA
jgi:hypothetical protein